MEQATFEKFGTTKTPMDKETFKMYSDVREVTVYDMEDSKVPIKQCPCCKGAPMVFEIDGKLFKTPSQHSHPTLESGVNDRRSPYYDEFGKTLELLNICMYEEMWKIRQYGLDKIRKKQGAARRRWIEKAVNLLRKRGMDDRLSIVVAKECAEEKHGDNNFCKCCS